MSKLRDQTSDCIKSWTGAVWGGKVQKCKRERNSKGKKKPENISPFYYDLQGNKSFFHFSLCQRQALLNWPAAIISTASCTTATLLDWLNVTRFCPVGKKKKNIQQTKKREVGRGSKSHIKRHNVGEQTDIFGDMSYKLLLGGKNTSSDSSIIVLIEHSSDWQTLCFLKKHRLLSFTRNRSNEVMSNKRWADSQCYTVKTAQYTWN